MTLPASNLKTSFHEGLLAATLFMVIVWPSYIKVKIPGLPGLSLGRVFLVLLVFVLLFGLLNKLHKKRTTIHFHSLLLFFLVLWSLLITFFSPVQLKSFYSTINWFLTGPLFFYYFCLFNDKKLNSERVVWYIFLSINFTAFIGLIEYINKGPLFDRYLISVDEFNEDIGIINIRDGVIRLKSVFAHPLIFAQFLLLNIFLTYHYLNECKVRYKKAILVLVLISSYFLMLQTDSRTGLFIAIVMPLFYLYFRMFSHKKTSVLIKALTTIIIVFLAIFAAQKLPELLDLARQSHTLNMQGQIEAKELSSLARITQLDYGSRAFIDSPLYGYGLGQALYNIPQLRAIDNYYLTLLLEIGALGLFLFLSVIFLVMKKSIKQIRYRYDPFVLTIVASISAILCFYLIISIPKINPILFVFLAILLSETRKAKRNE